MTTLDEEWLSDAIDHPLDLIDKALEDPRDVLKVIRALIAANGEIKALNKHVSILDRMVTNLQRDVEHLTEPEEDEL